MTKPDIQHTLFLKLALNFFPGNSCFIFSRFNNQTVVNILPEFAWERRIQAPTRFFRLENQLKTESLSVLRIQPARQLKNRCGLFLGQQLQRFGFLDCPLKIEHRAYCNLPYIEVSGCISLLRICQKRVKMKKLVKSLNKDEVKKMTPSDQQQLKAHLKAVAEILYRNTDPIELKSFESIEKSVRQKMLSEVGPELGSFFFQQYQEFKQENPEK